jgi:DNA-binding Lrp family transcriptional regulator
LDSLDVEVLRELFQGEPTSPTRPEVVLSYRTVAKRLKVSEETVRKRARRLIESGFVRGWIVLPNPRLLGLKIGIAMFDAARPKDRTIEQFILVDETFVVIDYHGSGLLAIYFYKDERSLSNKLALLQSIANGPLYNADEILFPPCTAKLSLLDWKVMAALQKVPSRSYAAVAAVLGVSARTVKRRVTRMSKERAIFLLPSGDETRLKGVLRADLIAKLGDAALRPSARTSLLALVKDYSFFSGLEEKIAFFNLILPSAVDASSILRNASSTAGVQDARLDFVTERKERYEVLRDIVESKLSEVSAPHP